MLGLIAAALAARFTLGRAAFENSYLLARFLVVGFAGAVIHFAVRLKASLYVVLAALLLFLSHLLLAPRFGFDSVLNAMTWSVPASTAFFVSSLLWRQLGRFLLGKFILTGILVSLGYTIATIVYLLTNPGMASCPTITSQALAGLRLGALVGFGLEIADLLAEFWRKRASRPSQTSP